VIGQRVRVLLERVDAVQKRLQFSIVEEEGAVAAGEERKARPNSKKAEKKKRHEDKARVSPQMQGKKPHRPKKIKRTKRRR
jgi:ribonuclease R